MICGKTIYHAKAKILLLVIGLCTTSCIDFLGLDDYRFCAKQLRPYVDSFMREARMRGININAHDLKIMFGHRKGETQGSTYTGINLIIIDKNSVAWKNIPEQLVYHELGHLYLHRDHDNAKIGFYPKSIMSADGSPVYETDEFAYMRDYYVNELFNPNEARPDWSYEKEKSEVVSSETKFSFSENKIHRH